MKKYLLIATEIAPVVIAAALPLFVPLSYQINLYLTWEGAFRLYEGQLPYRDFGMPMGYSYWILPALFFKLFGPWLYTLAKTQAFIHLISGLSFRWILVSAGASCKVRFLSLLIFSLTFVLGLIWPQYNHSVIVFQFVALAFIVQYLIDNRKIRLLFLGAGCFFLVYSFLIKQDGGGLGIIVAGALVVYNAYELRSVKPLLFFTLFLLVFSAIAILPFLQHDFGYWFNYGQPPHYSRISIADILRIIFSESRWEKFYFVTVVSIFVMRLHRRLVTRKEMIFSLLVIGMITEALIFQVTSYVPLDNNFFFHAFSAAYLLYQLDNTGILNYRLALPAATIFILIWWSEKYWKYAERVATKLFPSTEARGNVVSINTYILCGDSCGKYVNMSGWTTSPVKSFQHVKMPPGTVKGIDWFLQFMEKYNNPLVLNMSELTPLAYETPFQLEKGGPLWYHLNVGMFEKELDVYKKRIEGRYYDVVLYEHLPQVNNFYPLALRDYLQKHYKLVRSFDAPRSAYPGAIEVYCLPDSGF